MRNLTYRIDDNKHIDLKTKLMKEGNLSFQEFFDRCTDLYLNDELQITKEEDNMIKTIANYNEFQRFVVADCGLNREVAELRWGKWFTDLTEGKEFIEVNDNFKVSYDGNEIYADWEENFKIKKESVNND